MLLRVACGKGANERLVPLYGLLATAQALLELAADPRQLGGRIGLLMVLHTWCQLMDPHPHVHVVVPGGGLSLDGTRWVSGRDGFFLPVRVIGALVRGKFLAGLKRLMRDGKLKLDGKLSPLAAPRQLQSWLATLYAKNWVAYAQGPPSGVAGADAVLKYLARYVSGVALSDRRLVSHRNGRVTLRWKNYAHGGRSDTTTLEGVELVRRYMLHVLPPRFVRIRCYGLLSNRRRNTDLTRCLELLGAAPRAAAAAPAAVAQAPTDTAPARGDTSRCATCRRGRLVLLQSWPRPSVARLVARRSSLLGCTAAPHAAPRPEADRRSAAERSSAGRLRDTSSSRTGGLWPCATPLARRGTPPPSVRAAAGCPPAAT